MVSRLSHSPANSFPRLPDQFTYRLDLARAATSRDLNNRPRHRWFYFPHSYSDALLQAILDEWQLPQDSCLLDPFVGAGTTMVVARERGLSAIGFDLSPLAVLTSNVKAKDHDQYATSKGLAEVVRLAITDKSNPGWASKRLDNALSENEQKAFWHLREAIFLQQPQVRDFLLVALLRIVKKFSRAIADGGWFRWAERADHGDSVLISFQEQVECMLEDLVNTPLLKQSQFLNAMKGDAREVRISDETFDGLITSPPYPNRHDYSRIFHIELLVMGEKESDISDFRHRSLRSHVEARVADNNKQTFASRFEAPESLNRVLKRLNKAVDQRVVPMLSGYFEDLYTSLSVAYRGLKPGGRAAFVVGNVSYSGVAVRVDEIIQDVALQAGFAHENTWVIRLRGNSAQQMSRHGRIPSRESVVFLRKRGARTIGQRLTSPELASRLELSSPISKTILTHS